MIELINFLTTSYDKQFATLSWRNSEQVAKYFQIKYIEEEIHKNWLDKLKSPNPTTIAFFIRVDGQDVGVTYFHSIDYEKKHADWGMYIYYENLRGYGIGKEVLSHCLCYAKDELNLDKVFLEVLEDNLIARRVYENAGFKFVSRRSDGVERYAYA